MNDVDRGNMVGRICSVVVHENVLCGGGFLECCRCMGDGVGRSKFPAPLFIEWVAISLKNQIYSAFVCDNHKLIKGFYHRG